MAHQLDYSLTLQYPSDMEECASMVDARLWAALEQLAGQPHIAQREEGTGVECVLNIPEVPNLFGRSYQCLMAAQPVKLGGLGIRSLVETRHPAFLGGLEQALRREGGGWEVGRWRVQGACEEVERRVGGAWEEGGKRV